MFTHIVFISVTVKHAFYEDFWHMFYKKIAFQGFYLKLSLFLFVL